MAVTHGHGNPNWTKEETALALQLLLKRDMKLPASEEDPDSLELSQLLQSLEIHPQEMRKHAFRNGASVSFKMGNLRNVATGQGLKNTSKTDKLVWDEFGNNPEALDAYCDLVRATSNRINELPDDASEDDDDDTEFREGGLATRTHKRRERSKGLRKKILAARIKAGTPQCDICSLKPPQHLGNRGLRVLECHHVVPLSESAKQTTTKIKDIALLCANCHRLIHAEIAHRGRWLTIEEAKPLLGH